MKQTCAARGRITPTNKRQWEREVLFTADTVNVLNDIDRKRSHIRSWLLHDALDALAERENFKLACTMKRIGARDRKAFIIQVNQMAAFRNQSKSKIK
jgi:hypothetical protein